MKAAEVTRARMRNSGLSAGSLRAPDEVVRHHGAMQAQDYGPAKWSIGQRATKLVDDDLDRALATGSIIRTHVLRPTWHFIARDDIRWMLALTGPRVQQHNRPRYRELELDNRMLARCEAAIVSALEENQLTRNEIAEALDHAGIDRAGQRLPYILMHCELEAMICSGGRAGKHHTYALLDERVPEKHRFDRDEALVELTRRYLTSHGPATVNDLRWWSTLTLTDIKKALHTLGSEVQSETIDDLTFWSMAAHQDRAPRATGAHLLQIYDEVIVGYTESRFFGDPRAVTMRSERSNPGRPKGIVYLNGNLAGHWKRTIHKESVSIELLLYEDPEPKDPRALEAAAEGLGRFLGRQEIVELKRI